MLYSVRVGSSGACQPPAASWIFNHYLCTRYILWPFCVQLETNEPNDVELLNTLLALSVKGYSAIDVDMHGQLADLKALLTPECTANRLARAQGNSATDPANSSDGKTNIAAIVVPIVAVLLVAAIAATVLVLKGRGAGAYAEVERFAANAQPATTQPNPAFTPADAADAVPEPGSDEVQSTA